MPHRLPITDNDHKSEAWVMARQQQPLSKLTRGLAQAEETILLHLKHVHRRLVRIIYSAIPNKSVAVRTLYTPELRLSQAARDELEAIHVLTVGSNLYSKASFELRARPDRVGDYAIVDGNRLISCLENS
jgi:hypothetical protein